MNDDNLICVSVLHSEPMDTGSTDGEDDSSSQPNSGPGSRVTSHPSSPGGTPAVVTVDGIKLPSPPRGKKCPKVLQVSWYKITGKSAPNTTGELV